MQATISSTASKQTTQASSRALSIGLWTLQVLLAIVFLLHGWLMVAPPAEMVEMINAQLGVELRLFIGVAEVLAAIGLIAPGLTRILPGLTTLAAAGLMMVMSSATVLHIARGETGSAISAAVIFVLVSLVAYGRWKVQPLRARKRA
jgi:uncharacterized membrane protein YphA (DoxX/SURF4 family)